MRNDRDTVKFLLYLMVAALATLSLLLQVFGPRPHMDRVDRDGFYETPEGQPAVAEHVVIWEPAERPAQSCKWLLDDWQCSEVSP